jgi:hypothetical protein
MGFVDRQIDLDFLESIVFGPATGKIQSYWYLELQSTWGFFHNSS